MNLYSNRLDVQVCLCIQNNDLFFWVFFLCIKYTCISLHWYWFIKINFLNGIPMLLLFSSFSLCPCLPPPMSHYFSRMLGSIAFCERSEADSSDTETHSGSSSWIYFQNFLSCWISPKHRNNISAIRNSPSDATNSPPLPANSRCLWHALLRFFFFWEEQKILTDQKILCTSREVVFPGRNPIKSRACSFKRSGLKCRFLHHPVPWGLL